MNNDKFIIVPQAPRGASQLIETPVTTNGQGFVPLPVIQQLQNDTTQQVIIKALRLITVDVLSNGVIQAGVNAPLTELQKMSLVLYSQGWEKGQYIPILSLNDMFTEGSGIPFRYNTTKLDDWKNVDWNKSKIQYANGTVSAGAPYVVILEAEYLRLDMNGNPIEGVK